MHDAGMHEAGMHDVGSHEPGSHDAGSHDAGSPDAGSPDVRIPSTVAPGARRPAPGISWPDVVVRLFIALIAGGYASWDIYRSLLTWVPLAFLAAFLGVDGWRVWQAAGRLRAERRIDEI